jgi:hypothetical protein
MNEREKPVEYSEYPTGKQILREQKNPDKTIREV